MPISARYYVALTLLASASLGGCGANPPPQNEGSPSAFAGTYELLVCRGACGRGQQESAIVRGFLVIEAEPFSLAELPEAVRGYYERYTQLMLVHDDEIVAPNACFAFGARQRADSYAGGSRTAATLWVRDSASSFTIPLFRTPDAGYVATFTARGGEIRGSGTGWYGREQVREFPVDSLYGRRIGPPDRTACIRAAQAEAEKQARDEHRPLR
jgi:hypothetical protein